ncbi:hypothetical protein H5407_01290 [Mitsuaria sp. WAJ17]|uniref:hypothetical protein n=1 Tax=Mitsuaria sp. WAJ17 TaxID=2761452 RepID=UPI001602D295|nr:hypothetical protein [Mitsuaria sp. WAJ17]MBB2483854.1 hypothetical protein [Mitsuaria sp. WAJ17]
MSMDSTLSVMPHPHGLASPRIGLVPFSPYMLFVQDAALMVQGFHYEVRGEQLGWVVEGSAADGFEHHPVTAFDVQVRYAADGMRVEITGQAGLEVQQAGARRSFLVRFEIPKGRLAECFQLSEETNARVMSLFDSAFGPG